MHFIKKANSYPTWLQKIFQVNIALPLRLLVFIIAFNAFADFVLYFIT